MIKHFYIFRHGQSTYNVDCRIQGRTDDSKLSDLGKQQAEDVGCKLKGRGIEVIVTSPLKRAKQTAELFNIALGVPIIEDERFTEVDVGVVEGMEYSKLMEEYKDIYDKLHSPNLEDCLDVCYPQGETKREVQKRIFEGLEYWKDQSYQNIAISTHGITLAQIFARLDKYTADIPNCAILHLINENNTWKIVGLI